MALMYFIRCPQVDLYYIMEDLYFKFKEKRQHTNIIQPIQLVLLCTYVL